MRLVKDSFTEYMKIFHFPLSNISYRVLLWFAGAGVEDKKRDDKCHPFTLIRVNEFS